MKGKYTYLELFAGAGGLSEGFIRKGFLPIAHIEKDSYASLTIKTRMAYHFLKKSCHFNKKYADYSKDYIKREELYSMVPQEIIDSVINEEIRRGNLKSLFTRIKQTMAKSDVNEINIIAGGPPCQAYSLIGRARDPYNMERDPRNYLYKLYAEFLKEFKPDFFVFENVPGLMSAGRGKLWEDVRATLRKAGYTVDYRLLNAYDFGVIQKRIRIIVIGWRNDIEAKYPEFGRIPGMTKYTVGNIFEDLPPLEPGEKIHYGNYISPPSEYLKRHGIRKDDDILTQHIARRHNARDRKIYRMVIERWEKEKWRLKYSELPEHLKTHKNQKSFEDRFKVVAADLPYSHTMVAHLAKDGHYFIHPDITQLRSISVREAARLQSFPDDYYFEGPMTAKFRQIGNGVPPLMAEKIAEKIMEMIE